MHPEVIADQIKRLEDENKSNLNYNRSVAANIEKLFIHQKNISKRLDDAIEVSLPNHDKRIKKIEDKFNLISQVCKLWPVWSIVIIIAFLVGHMIQDAEMIKGIVKLL